MSEGPAEIAGRELTTPAQFRREVVEPCRPVVLRGLVSHWPAVEAGVSSPAAFRKYLALFDVGGQTEAFFGEPAIGGRYYYSDDLKGFNFQRRRTTFTEALDTMLATLERPGAPSVYMGSVPIEGYLPGFTAQNAVPVLPGIAGRIWLGHAAVVSPHYDAFENLACVVTGRRRFTLYAPEAIGQLYVGPIDNTMAGQPVSLAASTSPPDYERFPRFRELRDQALIADLAPGDALYLPKLWWHKVESTAPFNGLVNYWWDAFSAGPDAPYTSLLLSMITIAERPAEERQAWRAFFDHYVFRPNGHPLAHIPEGQRGLLGPLQPENYGKIRARVLQLLRGA
jgi:hypothetical protein